ncbi:uncharacterized protein LOC110839801 isoform X2 [Zootermopsis nevadensis]|uniref:uncharacterized protein LOC110839801 isoform X2 n=1 Tax=Zootermopsis nevadensis TaxID=136037 RepID=UPI000B8EDD17|nr:uncharacterized protein LOC110839801 isoform X2 [Zootermopsis nevadensis]
MPRKRQNEGKRSRHSAVDNLSFRLQGTLWRKPRKLVYCVTLIIIVCSHVGQALSNGRALHYVRSHGDCQPGGDSLAASTSRMSLGASGPVSGSWAPVGRGAIPKRCACTAHGPHLQARKILYIISQKALTHNL